MSNKLMLDINRVIENFSEIKDEKPIVGKPGENHIDDGWDNTTIYKGEKFLNLEDGLLFTSDGKYIKQLNRNFNYVLSGLEVKKPNTADDGIALDLMVTPGYAIINGVLGKFTLSNPEDISSYKIDLTGTTNTNHKFCLLYAKIDELGQYDVQETESLEIVLEQKIIEGTNLLANFDELSLRELDHSDILYKILYDADETLGLEDYASNKYLLLGVIFIRSNYDATNFNELEPISLTNTMSSYPVQEKSRNQLLLNATERFATFGTYRVFYKTQIVRHHNGFYLAHKTFGTGDNGNLKDYLINDNEFDSGYDSSEESNSRFMSSIIGNTVDDTHTPGEDKKYWCKLDLEVRKPTNINPYKYIIGTVPFLDTSEDITKSTMDIPEVYVNGVKVSVAFNEENIEEADVYFLKRKIEDTFDIEDYTIQDLEDLLSFSGRNIYKNFLLVWNKENTGYDITDDNFKITLHYKL